MERSALVLTNGELVDLQTVRALRSYRVHVSSSKITKQSVTLGVNAQTVLNKEGLYNDGAAKTVHYDPCLVCNSTRSTCVLSDRGAACQCRLDLGYVGDENGCFVCPGLRTESGKVKVCNGNGRCKYVGSPTPICECFDADLDGDCNFVAKPLDLRGTLIDFQTVRLDWKPGKKGRYKPVVIAKLSIECNLSSFL